MVLIPCCLLAAFPPGILFPQMAARMSAPKQAKGGEKSDVEKQTQAEGQKSQQPVVSGDESGPSEATATEKSAVPAAAVEPKDKDAA